ncbi:MAG: M28 family peptidase [Oscillospiraceae bacterium]|nr:M28 family peptidase [Oscillospiraceae bacterium]
MTQFHMDIVQKLHFNRYGGTKEEHRSAEIILEYIRSYGGEGEIQTYQIPVAKVEKVSLAATAPYEKILPVQAVGCSGSLPSGGVEAPLVYAERGCEQMLKDVAGKIVLVNNIATDTYRRLCESGALGFIRFSGSYNEDTANEDIEQQLFRNNMREIGSLPGVCVRLRDAIDLVKDGATRVRMELEQEACENDSYNVTAFIKGSEYPEEIVVMSAHHDSTPYGFGAWDNASGVANLLYLYRHFIQYQPKRSIRFVWSGSEEQGLLGTKAFIDANRDEVEKMKLNINIDMTGNILGHNMLICFGNEGFHGYVKGFAREVGHIADVRHGKWTSDSMAFGKFGIPSLNVCRSGHAGGHNRHDTVAPLSEYYLQMASDVSLAFSQRVLESPIFPLDRTLGEKMQKEADDYFKNADWPKGQ